MESLVSMVIIRLLPKVGTVKDGDYVVVVKRNDHVREEFKLKYDSSRAN